MAYVDNYLNAHGQGCTILRTPVVDSKVFMKRATRSVTNLGARDSFWEGLILAEANLESGEIFQVGTEKYLVLSVSFESVSGELSWFAAKINTTLTHKRQTQSLDESNNIVTTWETINGNLDGFGQIITYKLRQADPGLLDTSQYIFYVPKSAGVLTMDRLILEGENYQVNSVDDIMLAGVMRIQAGADTRV